MQYNAQRALELLRIGTAQPDAVFRNGQQEAIRHVVEGNGRLLLVQKTGWGKSYVYFIAAKMLREAGMGPTLLISPLLALMRNQILAAERMGVRTATINSSNTDDWQDAEQRLLNDQVDILLVSPERLANERFVTQVLAPTADRIGLLVVDEAHCISDWGHDFRPHYRLLERMIRTMPANLRLLATTATANDRVIDDLTDVLGSDLVISRGDLNRPSLTLQTIRLPTQAERLAWLAEQLPTLPGHGIIYTLTVRDAEQVAAWLQSRGINVRAYTSQLEDGRVELEQALLDNSLKALVATTALGMGFDKPDLAFVIHYQTPGSVVAYYQQVGRAGRALESAYGVLLSGTEETEITDYFIRSAFPTRDEVRKVMAALHAAPAGLSVPELLGKLNISYGRINKTLDLLALESPAPLVKQGTKWQLTAASLSDTFWQRAERLTELRRKEQQQMQDYVNLTEGHMAYLIEALDGDPATTRTVRLPALPTTPTQATVQASITFLKSATLLIEPRKQWASGGLPRSGLRGKIAPANTLQVGRALCTWGDAGWGRLVRQGKYRDGRFADELVQACAELVRAWQPVPQPCWVTAVPSLRHPTLVPDFAQRLAAVLKLPYHAVLVNTDNRPEQKSMANAIQQALNIDDSLAIGANFPKAQPVLLVDDMVDSRWTLTIAGWLLLSNGSGPVFPLALAQTGNAE